MMQKTAPPKMVHDDAEDSASGVSGWSLGMESRDAPPKMVCEADDEALVCYLARITIVSVKHNNNKSLI